MNFARARAQLAHIYSLNRSPKKQRRTDLITSAVQIGSRRRPAPTTTTTTSRGVAARPGDIVSLGSDESAVGKKKKKKPDTAAVLSGRYARAYNQFFIHSRLYRIRFHRDQLYLARLGSDDKHTRCGGRKPCGIALRDRPSLLYNGRVTCACLSASSDFQWVLHKHAG